jgi:hypothetical protein
MAIRSDSSCAGATNGEHAVSRGPGTEEKGSRQATTYGLKSFSILACKFINVAKRDDVTNLDFKNMLAFGFRCCGLQGGASNTEDSLVHPGRSAKITVMSSLFMFSVSLSGALSD